MKVMKYKNYLKVWENYEHHRVQFMIKLESLIAYVIAGLV